MSQLSSALLHANHTLTAIDHLVRRPDTGQTLDPHPDCFPTPGQKNPPPHPQETGSELRAETPGSDCQVPTNMQISDCPPNADSQAGLHAWHPQNLSPDVGLETQTQTPRLTASPALGFNSQPKPFIH